MTGSKKTSSSSCDSPNSSAKCLDPNLLSVPTTANAIRPSPYSRPPVKSVLEPVIYNFNRQVTTLPYELGLDLPEDLRHVCRVTRLKAEEAFKNHVYLENLYKCRFFRICALGTEAYRKHSHSIEILFRWTTDYNDFAVVSAKIPKCVINITLDKRAYMDYYISYGEYREAFLHGSYRAWIDAEAGLRKMVTESDISPYTKERFLAWWTGYRQEMRMWEDNIEGLHPPLWKEVVQELEEVLQERVDYNDEWNP